MNVTSESQDMSGADARMVLCIFDRTPHFLNIHETDKKNLLEDGFSKVVKKSQHFIQERYRAYERDKYRGNMIQLRYTLLTCF
jgi:hypothetical protein